MLIPFLHIANKYNFSKDKYILHIGAHDCEEKKDYNNYGFNDKQIIWIEGNTLLVDKIKSKYSDVIIFDGLISDVDNKEYDFIITNNGQSSSILELEEHLKEHPDVYEVNRYKKNTITIDTLLEKEKYENKLFEFVNIDIQGAELLALKGMTNVLLKAKYLYLEVNVKHLYKDCPLLTDIDEYLKKFGYERKEKMITHWGWGDALYVKK
jgi:FkbM family methyltransferase